MIYNLSNIDKHLKLISEKIYNSVRINTDEAYILFTKADLGLLGTFANYIRYLKHNNDITYIQNFHIEPSNLCIYNCKFCSYSAKNSGLSWDYSLEEIIKIVKQNDSENISEVHITGGVSEIKPLTYYIDILKAIKSYRPTLRIKAFSAVELYYMAKKNALTFEALLLLLKESGLESIPGGGAEIFDKSIRSQICPDKVNSDDWLSIHEDAHKVGLRSNATMLYGHIENYEHRIDHLNRLRVLQDKTNGFVSFIPLKFKNTNNLLSHIKEITAIEDLKNYAVSRIFLDNFPDIKAYWPMLGKQLTQLSLSFGVNDIDGTINDSTKIYSLAGVKESNSLNVNEIIELIQQVNMNPVERYY